MIRYIKRILFGKKKRYYNNNKPSWKDINELEDKYWKLNSRVTRLANSLDRKEIGDTFVTEKDAKKYNKLNNIF
tara:strand:+ start:539 stop:760 length:222 start_codon:yes stop_codon:yes gene_type:complete